MSKIMMEIRDETGLAPTAAAWVGGWINGGSSTLATLTAAGTFAPAGQTMPFVPVAGLPAVVLDQATNGNDRLIFVVSPQKPDDLAILGQCPVPFTQFPSLVAPGVAAPGPFDILEFGMNAQFDVSAVSGFGLNLRFKRMPPAIASMAEASPPPKPLEAYGVSKAVTRQQIGTAWAAFITREAESLASAADYKPLLWRAPLQACAYQPPLIGGQYFGLSDPNDYLAVLSGNYGATTTDPLAGYWDAPIADFFAQGNYLSINLGSAAMPNVFEGVCEPAINPQTGAATTAFQLSNAQGESHGIYAPRPGLESARYVFQQAFGPLTPAGAAGNAGLLQDCIWQALCRGVALDGIRTMEAVSSARPGFSTRAWNQPSAWYRAGKPCHLYAKFLHVSDAFGGDSRSTGRPPIFLGGAAYGFSMDENPIGPYAGPNVPSKTLGDISEGLIRVTLGAWA
ncbi:hypothetical protein [Roseibium aestuarii]|uniref:Beta-1,3-glucanase N-terminal domain-containing protein n=1 Tax=Roseibium aestuarii TaxID=2600299 RepID=A0ABW4JXM4_9HYPH|nr:hypothetical protein [Roseibium aestuarii]